MKKTEEIERLAHNVNRLRRKVKLLKFDVKRYSRGLSEARALLEKISTDSEEGKALRKRVDKHQYLKGLSELELERYQERLTNMEAKLKYRKLVAGITSGKPLTHRPFEVLRNFRTA